jgi:DNA-binding MarR family transcriptional regulator
LSRQVLSTQALPEVEAFAGLLRAHAATTRRFNAELVAEHGLTLSDYEVLLRLARAPGRRMRRVDLSQQVLLTPSGITRLLSGLEGSGFVRRASCDSDARVTYAELTDEGLEKLQSASKTHIAGIRDLFAEHFSASELESLRDLLWRLPVEDAADDPSCEP